MLSLLLWPFISLRRRILRSRLPNRPLAGRVVILGLDGLSPEVARRLMAEGRMPHLAGLAADGSFMDLETTCPGISPVAWTTFQTGVNPGRHGIFDFLAPDRRRYVPTLSSVETAKTARGRSVSRSLRRSMPFWQELRAFGVRSAVIRVPITYPPESLDGFLLSGMCVPDLKGSQGTYTLFGADGPDPSGGVHRPLEANGDNVWTGFLEGPPTGSRALLVTLRRRGNRWTARIGAAARVDLVPGKVTEWVHIAFRSAGSSSPVRGIVRLCLGVEGGSPRLYVSAVHPDPWSPPFPISSPLLYSKYLTGAAGPYATLGLAEDTWALMNGALDEKQFLVCAWSIFAERLAMFRDGLRRIRKGLLICVFDTSDRIQHIAWAAGTGRGTPVGDMYERMDSLVGETLSVMGRNDILIVMSDHGFTSFDWCLDMNRFLFEHGFLVPREGSEPPLQDLSSIDWDRSSAYSMGLAGIMLNLRGREGHGSVEPEDAESLMASIEEKLLSLVAPDGTKPVRKVFRAKEVYNGPYIGRAPDLIIGMDRGFRASWNCVTGGTGSSLFYRNELRWSGDHCHDHRLVPGILASNRKLSGPATIADIAPTALRALGLDKPAHIEGSSLLGEEG